MSRLTEISPNLTFKHQLKAWCNFGRIYRYDLFHSASSTHHDTNRPNVHLRVPTHSQNDLWRSVDARYDVASMLLVADTSLTKITENWWSCTERHWSRVVLRTFRGNRLFDFTRFKLWEYGVVLDTLEHVFGWNIWTSQPLITASGQSFSLVAYLCECKKFLLKI